MHLASSTASAEGQWVELCGRAEALAELEAPLSGRRCLLYRVVLGLLERLRGPRRSGQEMAGVSFMLSSEPGLLLVEPAAARLHLRTRLRARLRPGHDAARDARLAELFARLGRHLPRRAVIGREQRLEAGELVRVAGWVTAKPHPLGRPRGYRQPPELPVLLADWLRT